MLTAVDELIGVTARAAGIDEEGLRIYIADAKASAVGGGGLIRTTSRDLGIPYDELKKLVSRHRDLLPDEEDYGPEPEPEPCA
eukprot:COSAG04_NODE_945_length_9228_cov_3.344726_4_plen_83_part_00